MPRTLAFFCVCLTTSLLAAADQWPQFRGPEGDGRADAVLPLTFGEGERVKWKTEIHDKGWSSPVVWGDQIWMTTASDDGKRMYGVCVDRHSGQILHDVLVFEPANPGYCHPTNSYASPTPVVEEGRVYLHFGSYGTCCLDTRTGEKLWERRDLPCDHWRGPGSSPVVDGDGLFVALDGYDQQYIVALDKRTGKTLWKKDRDIDYETDNGDRKKAYSTCAVIEYGGRRQLVSPSAMETITYDPANGDVLWRVRHGGMNACARPLFGNGLVYIAAGDARWSLIAVRPDGSGDVTESHLEWTFGKSAPKRPSQLLDGEYLYMMSDEGVATCINARTAEIVWQERVGGAYRASPILAGGRIYCFGVDGRIPVLAAEPRFQLLADNQLGEGFQASPAVVGNSLYLRSTTHLYCIE